MTAWWAGLGRAQRIGLVVVAAVVAVNVVLSALGDVVPRSPGGPGSSTYGTAGDGLAAYADLLEESGHDVTRLRSRVTPADLPADATAVVADPAHLTRAEAAALGRFLVSGGRLVVSGEAAVPLVVGVTGESVGLDRLDSVAELQVWIPTTYTGAATTLSGDGGHRWASTGPLIPLAGVDGRATLLTVPVGEGRLLALADTGPLLNRHLAQLDNAALGLALAGPDRPVVFVESVHGYAGGGLGAVPTGWRWAAGGLGVALVLGLWAAGTRFGPPEPAERTLRPPRRDYVDAVAATMRRGVAAPADLVDALVPSDERAPTEPVTLTDALALGTARAEQRRRHHAVDAGPAPPPTVTTDPDRPDPPGARP